MASTAQEPSSGANYSTAERSVRFKDQSAPTRLQPTDGTHTLGLLAGQSKDRVNGHPDEEQNKDETAAAEVPLADMSERDPNEDGDAMSSVQEEPEREEEAQDRDDYGGDEGENDTGQQEDEKVADRLTPAEAGVVGA